MVGETQMRESGEIETPDNLYPIPAWIYTGNGYGKFGETQVREFGEIETPILLTEC